MRVANLAGLVVAVVLAYLMVMSVLAPLGVGSVEASIVAVSVAIVGRLIYKTLNRARVAARR